MPIDAKCSLCSLQVPWGEVVRRCYARRDAADVLAGAHVAEEEEEEDEEEEEEGEEDDLSDSNDDGSY